MTSSARASSDGGIVSPSALAVLRLMTSSNLVGCSIGRLRVQLRGCAFLVVSALIPVPESPGSPVIDPWRSRSRRLRRVAVGQAVDDDVGASLGERLRDALSNAASGAGDEGD